MNIKTQKSNKYRLETIKWVIVFILLILAIIGSYLYTNIILVARIIIIVTLISVAIGIILLTKRGKSIISFTRETYAEIYKVVWPSYNETLYATLTVIAVTIIVSLILWGLDSVLVRLISFITT